MNNCPDADDALLSAWRAGDTNAGSQLVRLHFSSVSRFFRSRAPAHEVDLMQRVWLGCIESRDRVPAGLPFKVYLFGIARRVLYLHYRGLKRTLPSPLDEEVRDEGYSPSAALTVLHQEKHLLAALRQLPLDLQLTLELFYWEDLGVAEVGAVLEVPPGTIKSRLSRARRLLRKALHARRTSRSPPLSIRANPTRWAHSIRRFLGRTMGSGRSA